MSQRSPDRFYHHGDLRPALVAAAIEAITEGGTATMSPRDVARRAGVTHTAAAYHFGDKAGLLAAVAAEGYELLADELATARDRERSFLAMGVAYVRFAIDHPAHFDVMYERGLYDPTEPAVAAARAETAVLLYGTSDATTDQTVAGVAAWSIVHGFVTLWRTGNIPAHLGDDPEAIARAVASHLPVRRRHRG